MLLGKVLALSALRKGLNVTWFPSYGAEVRGGAAHCMVIISSEEIPSPYIDKADTLIVMNEPSLFKFSQKIKTRGLLLVNGSLVNRRPDAKSKDICVLPFTEAAAKLGNIKIANMIALGAYIAKTNILSKQIVFEAIKEIAPAEKKSLIEINKQAIEEGIRLVK